LHPDFLEDFGSYHKKEGYRIGKERKKGRKARLDGEKMDGTLKKMKKLKSVLDRMLLPRIEA